MEVDVFLVGGRLLVAHDREDVDPRRELETLYLKPLREHRLRLGSILPDGRTFYLNIELKSPGIDAYRVLGRVLGEYRDMLTVVREGRELPGAVQVVMVGWHPSLEDLSLERERLVAVQWLLGPGEGCAPAVPAHLVRLVSLDYGRNLAWSEGRGGPRLSARSLERLLRARDEVPGRVARVFDVPAKGAVYRSLLDSGVDLIGTKHLLRTRKLLESIRAVPASPP